MQRFTRSRPVTSSSSSAAAGAFQGGHVAATAQFARPPTAARWDGCRRPPGATADAARTAPARHAVAAVEHPHLAIERPIPATRRHAPSQNRVEQGRTVRPRAAAHAGGAERAAAKTSMGARARRCRHRVRNAARQSSSARRAHNRFQHPRTRLAIALHRAQAQRERCRAGHRA